MAGNWLYRAIAIYFLWNIYLDVQSTNKSSAVYQERLDRHELRLNNIEQNLFVPAYEKYEKRRETSLRDLKESEMIFNYTCDNIAGSIAQLGAVDSFLDQTKSN